MTPQQQQMQQLASRGVHQPKHHIDDVEHRIQCSCVTWFRFQYPKFAHNLFAVPNGGKRDKATAGKLKAEGLLPGVSDLILLKPNATYSAMLIEMKTPSGEQSDSQRQWQQLIQTDGYLYVICRSLEDFQREVRQYLASAESY